MLKNALKGIARFFTTLVPNLKKRDLTDGQLRLFVIICTFLLAFLVSRIFTDGSAIILIGAWLATIGPDYGGLWLQRSKNVSSGQKGPSFKQMMDEMRQMQKKAAQRVTKTEGSAGLSPEPGLVTPAIVAPAGQESTKKRTFNQRQRDAKQAKRGKNRK